MSIRLVNGLGDKLLDLIGFFVICKYLNYTPNVIFCNSSNFAWGNNHYDNRLFNFHDIIISEVDCAFYVNSCNPSSSLCPYKVYEFIKRFIDITFERISQDFLECSRIIQPSEIIVSKIPLHIEKAYGIHLRKSDKLNNIGDIRHENTVTEFKIIIHHLLKDVEKIILTEEEPTFLIVSEDNDWKRDVTNVILKMSNKPIHILTPEYCQNEYSNYNSVLDMFCLSKCKEILQGVKYSTFSIVASLLGNHKIRNYSTYTNSHEICLIHSWSSVVEINQHKNVDVNLHKKVTKEVKTIETNIPGIFTDECVE